MKPPAVLSLIAVIVAGSLTTARAASPPSTPAAPAAEEEKPADQAGPTTQLSEFAKNYIAAYNKGDAKALANFFAEDAEYIDADGELTKGRAEIEKLLATAFQENPGAKLEIAVDELTQVTPEVVVSRGVATVTPESGAAEATRFEAIRVKKGTNGRFRI